MKLLNAFSLNMLKKLDARVRVDGITQDKAREFLNRFGLESCVGHADTAKVLEGLLDLPVPMNRATVELVDGEVVMVAQYKGPRLPEGAMKLPAGATVEWATVQVDY